MPHEKQGAITLLDEEARFKDKGKFASASTHLSSVKDILAVSQWQEKIQNSGATYS
jgi:hypothetical protein